MSRKSGSNSQTTCYVVAYDISNDKRRTKIHKILLRYGKWTQYSLFECFLSKKDFILLQSKLSEHLIATQLTNLSPRCGATHELTPQVMGERVALSCESFKPEVLSGRRRWRHLAPWLIRSSTPL